MTLYIFVLILLYISVHRLTNLFQLNTFFIFPVLTFRAFFPQFRLLLGQFWWTYCTPSELWLHSHASGPLLLSEWPPFPKSAVAMESGSLLQELLDLNHGEKRSTNPLSFKACWFEQIKLSFSGIMRASLWWPVCIKLILRINLQFNLIKKIFPGMLTWCCPKGKIPWFFLISHHDVIAGYLLLFIHVPKSTWIRWSKTSIRIPPTRSCHWKFKTMHAPSWQCKSSLSK